jgi:O-antigen/teichoic acid export membrane protein
MAADPTASTTTDGPPPAGRIGRGTLNATLILTAANLFASLLNYVSNIAFGRILAPEGYSELSSLLALTVIFGVTAAAGQTVLAERVAFYRAAGDLHTVRYLARHSIAHMAVIGGVVALAVLLSTPLLMELLSVNQPGPILALAGLSFVSFLYPVGLGLTQGLERADAYAALAVAAAAGRLLVGLVWVGLGGGAGGAIAGQALGIVIAGVAGIYALRRYGLGRGHGAVTAGLRRRPDFRALQASGAYTLFAIIGNVDVIVAKILLSSREAGYYAALSTVAKIIAYLPAAASVLVVPRTATADGDHAREVVLRRAAAFSIVLMGIACAPMIVAPGWSFQLMFGADYAAAEPGIPYALIAGAGLGIIGLLVAFSVAIRHGRWQLTLVVGVTTFVGLAAVQHDSAADVARAQAVGVLVALLINEVLFHSLLRPRFEDKAVPSAQPVAAASDEPAAPAKAAGDDAGSDGASYTPDPQ